MVTQTKVKVKEWGNSLGLIIPNEIVVKEEIKPNDEIVISTSKKNSLENFFGKARERIDAQKMKDEAKRLWKMN